MYADAGCRHVAPTATSCSSVRAYSYPLAAGRYAVAGSGNGRFAVAVLLSRQPRMAGVGGTRPTADTREFSCPAADDLPVRLGRRVSLLLARDSVDACGRLP